MPTYEYECRQCHRRFEIRQRISEPALTTCDQCGGPVQRLLAAAPFILKGGGWYVTDYPSADRKKALSSESGDKPSPNTSEVKSGASTDSSSSPSTSQSSDSKSSTSTKDSSKPASSTKEP